MTRTPPRFRPRWPWFGGDLQTLRNFLRRPRHDLPGRTASVPIEIDVGDGSGDRLLGLVDLPRAPRAGRPAVLLVHGLTGCSESVYMRASAAALLAAGHAVLRLNLRGAGAGAPLARGAYHAGASRDVAAAIAAVPAELARDGVAAIGFSLGGNMLLKHLAETGRASGLVRAASVSAPIDLAQASRRICAPRNAAYHFYLLRRMREGARTRGAALAPAQRRALATVRDIRAFDDLVVAPSNGFAGADDYYARCSAGPRLADIATPTLLVLARDDPWIPTTSYETVPWQRLPALRALLPSGGGHLGFHAAGGPIAWHDRAILDFLAEGAAQPRSISAASSAK
jgi:predicted alpha/beta-fold hydrolase